MISATAGQPPTAAPHDAQLGPGPVGHRRPGLGAGGGAVVGKNQHQHPHQHQQVQPPPPPSPSPSPPQPCLVLLLELVVEVGEVVVWWYGGGHSSSKLEEVGSVREGAAADLAAYTVGLHHMPSRRSG